MSSRFGVVLLSDILESGLMRLNDMLDNMSADKKVQIEVTCRTEQVGSL